jgi:hypothetical protein
MSPFALIELQSKKGDTSASQFLGTLTEPAYKFSTGFPVVQ